MHESRPMKLTVKAHPKSKKVAVKKIDDTHYEIWIREAPEKGRANDAVIETLSDYLKIPKSRLTLLSGQKSKHKVLLLS